MREIKFRAWDTDKNKMVKVDTIDFYNGNVNDVDFYNQEIHFGFSTILLQYTGVKDENMTDIYEGDIVQFETNDFELSGGNTSNKVITDVVAYDSGSFYVDGIPLHVPIYDELEITIIGNIYEHPELLEHSNE